MKAEVFAGPFRLRDMRYVAGETHSRHAHEELQISFVLQGAMCEETNGVAYRGGAGDIIVKPGGVMHSDRFEPTRIVCIDVDPQAVEFPFGGYAWHRAPCATAAALRVTRTFLAGEDPAADLDDLLGMLCSRPIADRAVATRAARLLDDAFPDPPSVQQIASQMGVPEGLARLAKKYKLVILSNASDDQIHSNVDKLGAPFHRVYTAQQAQAYKPRQQAFEYMFDQLDCNPEDVLHVSSSFRYDLMTAYDMGIRHKAYVNRNHEPLNSYYQVNEVSGIPQLAALLGL